MVLSRETARRALSPLVPRAKRIAGLLFIAGAAACGAAGGSPEPAVPGATSPREPLPGEWARWSHEQKAEYMKTVLAQEKPLFSKYDPAKFADFSCKACHGAGVENGSFKMPNPALPKLEPGKIIELARTNPELYNFMAWTIVPRTARLLGEPVFDHSTMKGFGCFRCHTVQR